MASSELRILVPLESPSEEQALTQFAANLAQTRNGELHLTHIATPQDSPPDANQQLERVAELAKAEGVATETHIVESDDVTTGIQETLKTRNCNMIVMGWYHAVERDAILAAQNRALTKATNVDTLIFKHRDTPPIKRILVPTGGGNNALMGIQLASELARLWQVPIEIVRVARDLRHRADDPILKRYCEQLQEGTKLQLELLGVDAPVQVQHADDVVESIVKHARETDLLVLGASNDWIQEDHLAGSIPDEIANKVLGSVLMVRSLTPNRLRLSSIFWENTIRLDLQPTDKWDAITQMVDALVDERQVPASQRDNVLKRALERERKSSTALGHETAIPHAPIPDLPNIIGCLGICPQGVNFEGLYADPVRCIFLLLTPQQNYLSYIPLLAQIATFMKVDENRNAVLQCQTPSEVVSLIRHQEKSPG